MDSRACFVKAPGHEPIVLLQRKLVKGLQLIPGVSKEDVFEGEKISSATEIHQKWRHGIERKI